ncbi:MFS transporter (plasmid) [Glutamicibacter sp. FR1]|uniref:MFS transporter n=1 Tax=Glutamicibacter sp. FR1 TaxID=3393744 RepID=UPI0039AEE181
MSKIKSSSSSAVEAWILVGVQAVSSLGTALSTFGLAIHVLRISDDLSSYAMSLTIAFAPSVVLFPFAGAFIDRFGWRPVLLWSCGGSSIALLAFGLFFERLADSVPATVLLMIVLNAWATFILPALDTGVAGNAANRELSRMVSAMQTGEAVSRVVGPALAALVFANAGLVALLLLDALSFLVACLAIILATGKGAILPGKRRISWKIVLEGATLLLRSKQRRILMLFLALLNVSAAAAFAALTPVVLSISTEESLGKVLSVGGIAAFATSLLLTVIGPSKPELLLFAGSGCILGGIVAISLRPHIWLISCGVAITLIGLPLAVTGGQVLMARLTSKEFYGRVFAARSAILRLTTPLGSAALAMILGVIGTLPSDNTAFKILVGARTDDGTMLAICLLVIAVATFLILLPTGTRLRQSLVRQEDVSNA